MATLLAVPTLAQEIEWTKIPTKNNNVDIIDINDDELVVY